MVQNAEPGASPASAQPAQDEAGEAGGQVDIVVTGSRIVTDGTRAPTPLTVVSSESLTSRAPGSLAEGLNQLPIFQGAINSQMTQLVTTNRVRSGNYMNLRNLGPQRVLVLWDGYRLPPSGNNGGVDTNIIPQMLIERVEVVTGGASAVYGSDAVSGVVNYILDKRFSGVKALAQTGISTYGDAFSYRLGAAAGTALLDDRLRLQLSAEYYSNDGIPRRSARPGGADSWITGARDPSSLSGALGTINNPYVDYPNVTVTNLAPGGLIIAGPASVLNQQFLPTGALGAFNRGTPIGRPGFGQGSNALPNCLDCTLVPESTTGQLFGRASYDFGSDVSGFVQASYNTATNYGENTHISVGDMYIYGDNYYLAQSLTPAQLADIGTGRIQVGRRMQDWDTRAKRLGAIPAKQDMTSLTITTGLAGGLFADWKWDAAFTYGMTDVKSVTEEVRSDRFFAAIDTVAGPGGAPVCRVTLVSSRFSDCKPLNVLGVGRADPAAVQWVLDDSTWRTKNHLYFGGLNFTGSLFSTWAGPVSLAFGAEYRKQEIVQTSNSDPAVPVDFTGLRGTNGGVFRSTNVGVADGTYNVKEFYAETVVPLIKDAPFTNSLELNAAFRHADYSTSGGVNTWKIGATWEPVEDISFRGAFSRDIRAPSLFELFAGQTVLSSLVFDPVTNQSHNVFVRGGGNLNLRPEKADTLTLGVVLKPTFVPGFYGSIDYFDIKIKDAIGTPGAALQIFQACAVNPASPLCDLIKRDSNNIPLEVSGVNNNVAELSSRGVDFEFGYRADVGNGRLTTRVLGTRLLSFKRQDTAALPLVEYVGTSDLPGLLTSTFPLPKWRANLDISYSNDSFTVGLQQRMIGGYVKSKIQYYVDNHIEPVFYTDINFAKKLSITGEQSEAFVTVNNLFNRKGPFFLTDQNPGTQLPTARAIYDVIGRYITVGVRTRF
ncbi:TonB-dependent siderophore receptor [uncultured Sphingomonas sp.]|uniref:TonB-dependent receptor plug domain-containing protein n=1 Tax=uncultured Sphingomonas sp. TaxID=158754 RepID=UPI0026178C13|nr:TonB-dependent receptor [uncultured Sphingomonas sp.]